jgi:hypothetical protein
LNETFDLHQHVLSRWDLSSFQAIIDQFGKPRQSHSNILKIENLSFPGAVSEMANHLASSRKHLRR